MGGVSRRREPLSEGGAPRVDDQRELLSARRRWVFRAVPWAAVDEAAEQGWRVTHWNEHGAWMVLP
jgi:hypothetical protein